MSSGEMFVLFVYRYWKVFQSNISNCKTFWTPLVRTAKNQTDGHKTKCFCTNTKLQFWFFKIYSKKFKSQTPPQAPDPYN